MAVPDPRLRVHWFAHWSTALDDALNTLPEMDGCPRQLYKQLLTESGPSPKEIALVTERDEPVAVIGLRQGRFPSHELVTRWLVPGQPFVARSGSEISALKALRKKVDLSWWRFSPVGVHDRAVISKPSASHGMRCADDFEAYWSRTSLLKSIRQARKRCTKYRIEENPAGGAEWVIRAWSRRWGSNPDHDGAVFDRILIAKFLEPLGKHFSQVIYDADTPIAGATHLAHGDASVASVMYYSPHYNADRLGARTIALFFEHAQRHGFAFADLGGGQAYKKRWAPAHGRRAQVSVWPPGLRRLRSIASAPRRLRTLRHSLSF